MNLTGIIALLQLVSVMLSNPTTAQNPQFQILAANAIQMAQNALSQSMVPTGGSSETGTSQPPTFINQPVSNQPIAITTSTTDISPYCTISAVKLSPEDTAKQDYESKQAGLNTHAPYYDISWTLTNISTSTRGKLLDMSSPTDPGTDMGLGLMNQGVGRFPNQNKIRVGYNFKNLVGADFNGIKCYANPS